MPPLLQAVCWGLAAVAIALVGAFGLIPGAIANMLVIILPIIMVTTITTQRRRCSGKTN